MGKRRGKSKVKLTLSIDEELLYELIDDGVNKSKLFSTISRKYLRRKRNQEEKPKKNN